MNLEIEELAAGWRRRARQEADLREVQRRRAVAHVALAARELKTQLGVRRVVLFGSRARGTALAGADFDVAVEGLPRARFFEALRLLEAALGKERVDLVEYEDARPALRRKIDEGIELDE